MKSGIRKRSVIFIRLLAILGIVFTTGCGKATPSSATQVSGSGNLTITFADLHFGQAIDSQKLADAFHQKNPNIIVTVIPVDHSVQLADADIAKQADVVLQNGENPAALPGFTTLQPLLDAANDFNSGDLWPGSMAACSDAQGSPYGVPLSLFLEGVYYNPSLFDLYHTAYPQPGWTWSQFQQDIAQLSGIANGSTLYGFVDGPEGNLLYPFIVQQILANGGRVDAKAMADSSRWYVQLASTKKLYPMPAAVNGVSHPDAMITLIKNNQAAMWLGWTESLGSLTAGLPGVYLPYPVSQPEDHTTPVGVFCGAISAGTKNPQAAWAWLDFLSHQDLSGDKASGLLPARQSLAGSSPYYASLSDSQRNAIQFGLAHAWYLPLGLQEISNNVIQAIANSVQSGADLEKALQGGVASIASLQPTATPTSQPIVVNTPQGTPTNLPDNVVTITFDIALIAGNKSMGPAAQDPAMQALVKEFEKDHPEIRVVFAPSGYNWPSDNDVFRQAATSDDCFMFGDPSSGWQSAEEGYLLDLTPFLDATPGLKDDFFPVFLDYFHINGKWYGLPAAVQLNYIAYNADLLAQKGIALPKTGWTVDDLLALATQVADPSASKPIYGFGDDNAYIFHTLGVPWYDSSVQPPKGIFTNDPMVKAFTWIKELMQKGTLYPYNQTSLAEYQGFMNAISGGQVAFWPTDGWRNYNLDPWTALDKPIYDQNLPFKVGYVPFPLLSSGKAMSDYLNLVGYYISSHTTHAKAAACWDWIQYLSAQPNYFGGFSPRPSILPSEDLGQDPARFAVVQAAIQQYNHEAYSDMGKPLLDPYTEELYSSLWAISAGADVTVTLAAAQGRADAYLACIAQKDLTGLFTPQIFKLVQGCYAPDQITPQP